MARAVKIGSEIRALGQGSVLRQNCGMRGYRTMGGWNTLGATSLLVTVGLGAVAQAEPRSQDKLPLAGRSSLVSSWEAVCSCITCRRLQPATQPLARFTLVRTSISNPAHFYSSDPTLTITLLPRQVCIFRGASAMATFRWGKDAARRTVSFLFRNSRAAVWPRCLAEVTIGGSRMLGRSESSASSRSASALAMTAPV